MQTLPTSDGSRCSNRSACGRAAVRGRNMKAALSRLEIDTEWLQPPVDSEWARPPSKPEEPAEAAEA